MISSFQTIASEIGKKQFNCVSLVEDAIEAIDHAGKLNIFIEVFHETALKQAHSIDEKIKKGEQGKLAGMVIAIKDNICYKDHISTASSKILDGFVSLFSATAVDRLVEQDAIIIGRVGCDEFAMGSSNENSYYGPIRNPHNPDHVPGGSSGGAAAAVAAGLCHTALGSDTGGSVRQPASFTGTFGIYPTYGRVSRNGLIAFSSSFDQIGPIASNLSDLALVLEIISGKDEFDSTSSDEQVPGYSTPAEPKGKMRFAYFKSYMEHDGLDQEIRDRFVQVLDFLKKQGHEIEERDFSLLDHLVPTYYVLTTAEASSNLARYDGIHYGYLSGEASDLISTYTESRSEGFGTEVKRRIMLGTYVLSEGFYDAYYSKAQKVRRKIRDMTTAVFQDVDFILSPTSPHTAFKIGEKVKDPIKMYAEDIFTVQSNLSGTPAISLPLGKHSNGLPFGIQLWANKFKEDSLLNTSRYLMNNLSLE